MQVDDIAAMLLSTVDRKMITIGQQGEAPEQVHRGITEGSREDGIKAELRMATNAELWDKNSTSRRPHHDPHTWAVTIMGKSSKTVMDTSCIECGHIPVNHLLRQMTPKPAEPAV